MVPTVLPLCLLLLLLIEVCSAFFLKPPSPFTQCLQSSSGNGRHFYPSSYGIGRDPFVITSQNRKSTRSRSSLRSQDESDSIRSKTSLREDHSGGKHKEEEDGHAMTKWSLLNEEDQSGGKHNKEDEEKAMTKIEQEEAGVVPTEDEQATRAVEMMASILGQEAAGNSTIASVAKHWLFHDNGSLNKSRVTNLAILLMAGVYAVSLLLTVDMEIWRGWDLGEILVRLPYDNWQEYEAGLTTNPILVKTVINVVIYLVGDWMAQVGWGRTRPLLDFDLARTARNGLIGAFFGPLVAGYYSFSDWILPMDVPINRVLKIVMDQTIYFITKCSVYIALVGLLRGDSQEQVTKDVKEKLWPVVKRGWSFWPFVHMLTYTVIPPRHRILWVNCVDIIWSYLLASLTTPSPPPTEPPGPPGLQPVKVPTNETTTIDMGGR